jgi:hypothetical protein
MEAGDTLMLEYVGYPTEMTADSGGLGVGVTAERSLVRFVVEYALGVVHQAAASRGGGDFRQHWTLAERHFEAAELLKRGAPRVTDPGRIRWGRWSRSRG